MTGIPGLEQCQRFSAANFTDDYAVGTCAHCGARKECEVRCNGRMKLHHVRRVAMQFESVLDDNEALVRISEADHLVKQDVRQRRLAGAGSAREHDVFPSGDCSSKLFSLVG